MADTAVAAGSLADLLPTDDDVAAFQRDGFYVSKKIIPDALLDAAVDGSERYYRGEMAPGPRIPEYCEPKVPIAPGLRKHDYSSLRCPELAAVRDVPAIGAIAARLAGVDTIRLWHDQLLYKPADSDAPGNVGWHTDRSYWMAAASDNMLTAWVPFHTITPEHGPLMFLAGSNRWDEGQRDGRDFFRQDLEQIEAELAGGGRRRELVKVPVLLEKGQVSFHHCRTFHGSGPNRAATPRRSIAIHLQPGDNHFSGLREADGSFKAHWNNELVRRTADGLPDYTDPTYCPTLWPRGTA